MMQAQVCRKCAFHDSLPGIIAAFAIRKEHVRAIAMSSKYAQVNHISTLYIDMPHVPQDIALQIAVEFKSGYSSETHPGRSGLLPAQPRPGRAQPDRVQPIACKRIASAYRKGRIATISEFRRRQREVKSVCSCIWDRVMLIREFVSVHGRGRRPAQ